MLAGIDFGASLIKIAIPQGNGYGNEYALYSEADYTKTDLVKLLKLHSVTHAITTGIGDIPKQFRWLRFKSARAYTVRHEVHTQTTGLRELTALPTSFFLASIGTGVSYTHVGSGIQHEPLGSALGGGYLDGMVNMLGYVNIQQLLKLAANGNTHKVDLEYHKLLVSHFKLATRTTSKADIAAGLMNMIAVGVWKDVAALSKEKHVVIIGTTIRDNACLKTLLRRYLKQQNKTVMFPADGEFSSAVGALQSARH